MRTKLLVIALVLGLGLFACRDQGGGGEQKPTPEPKPSPSQSPTPAKFSKSIETPCEKGKLSVSHAYSECGPDGFWHVVQDDYYDCPPVQVFRTGDTPTTQACKATTGVVVRPPNPIGNGYKSLSGDSTCVHFEKTDQSIAISVCENGFWVNEFYRIYRCEDRSIRISNSPDSVTKTEKKCDEPPPSPPIPKP